MFPEDVGFPIGLPGQSRYVSLTIHYSNYFNEGEFCFNEGFDVEELNIMQITS